MSIKKKIGRILEKIAIQNLREKFFSLINFYGKENTHLLDLGCGLTGSLDYNKLKKRVILYGFDATKERTENFLKLYKKKVKKIKTINLDRANTLFGKYDMIILGGVIQYLRNPKKTLQLIKKSLNPDGILIISTVNKENLLRKLKIISREIKPEAGEKQFYSPGSFKTLLESSGFSVIKSEGSDFMPLPKDLRSNIICICKLNPV